MKGDDFLATKVNGIKKITNLTDASTINDADVFMIETTSGSRKVTGAILKTIINNLAQTKADAAAALIADEFDANNSYVAGDYVIQGGKLYKFTADHATGAFDGSDVVEVTVADEMVSDVLINGTSIVDANGDANIPIASANVFGVTKINTNQGIGVDYTNKTLMVSYATETLIKPGVNQYKPIVPANQHISAFYALSKLAGVDLANETVTLGTYPNTAKTAIRAMLGLSNAEIVSIVEAGLPSAEGVNW